MDNLPAVLKYLNLPEGKAAVVQERVERRLSTEIPTAWCAKFRQRAAALMNAQIFSPDYAENYHALRGLLSQEGIATYVGEHGMDVPDQEVDRTPKPVATSGANKQLPLPSHFTRTPVTPVTIDPASVLASPPPADVESATPAHCDTIRGLWVPRNDGAWIFECDVLRGHRIQVATVMDDNTDCAVEVPFTASGEYKINLQLPPGRSPQMVVVVVLDDAGQEVGRGIVGTTTN